MSKRGIVQFDEYKITKIKSFKSPKTGEIYYTLTVVNPDDGNEKFNVFCFEDSLAFQGVSCSQADQTKMPGRLLMKEGDLYNLTCKIKFSSQTINGKFYTTATIIKLESYTHIEKETDPSIKKEVKPIGKICGFGGE